MLFHEHRYPRTIRAGFSEFPPYFSLRSNGSPAGFAIDAFEEAARRRGITVEWVEMVATPELALLEHQIDVYPLMVRTPERLKNFGLSEAWWENMMVMVSRADHPVKTVKDLRGQTISSMGGSFDASLLRRAFPVVNVLSMELADQVLSPVCDGRAVAAVLEARAMDRWMLDSKRLCPSASLYAQSFNELSIRYGIGALKENAWLADELHSTLLDLTMDGTMYQLGARWNVFTTNQIGMFQDLVRVKDQRLWLALLVLSLIAGMLAFARLYFRSREARRLAEAASASQSQFLANVSHEIRTPLNGILGMVDLLRSTSLQPAQRDFTDAISSSGQVLLALINDFLDLAKIEAGKLDLESIRFSPMKLTEQVVQNLYPRAQDAGISIGAYVDPAISETVKGDPTRIQQVLFNLVGNAVKFTAEGEVWIEVERVGEGALRFAVFDTGAGVPEESRERLFQRFTQADASTTRKHGGTGLGLAICRELVRLMGGELGYQPRPGGGSQFWFTVMVEGMQKTVEISPLERRVAVAADAHPDVSGLRVLDRVLKSFDCEKVSPDTNPDLLLSPGVLMPPVRQSQLLDVLGGRGPLTKANASKSLAPLNLRILVVEDNAVNQRVVMHYLNKLGCEAKLVENGQLAVEAALGGDYDVILMDYQMPVMDGLTAARNIRAGTGKRSEVPILAITAGVLAIDRERIRMAGMDDLLPKPYSLDALRTALETASRSKRGTFQK
ncbi:hybrid sensor histidine kinase/response regulator [Bryobacter aggregatus]|uniref:hybrid sensor histidine kinase/response regulator n=1 Tax=Bryobacter aggregatus TaxID=360054 RepID=UPI00068AAE6A|nr:ATP-binding protein [Bryobacter aggregatus]